MLEVKEETVEVKQEEEYTFSLNDSEGNGIGMEELQLLEDTLEMPADIFSNRVIFNHIFSTHTWNNFIKEDIKQNIMSLLPNFPRDNMKEKIQSLEMLFGGENISFGNPLEFFREEVVKGNFGPDKLKMRQYIRNATDRDSKLHMEEIKFRLMHDILKSRKSLLEETSGSPVSIPLAVQRMEKQTLKLGNRIKIRSKKRYLEEMRRIKAELGEEGLSSDDEELLNFCKESEKEIALIPEFPGNTEHRASSGKIVENFCNLDEDKMRSSLTQESQPSYFHLVRDLFLLGTEHRLSLPELDQALSVWQESPIAALNSWYSLCSDPRGWRSCIPSVISFLAGSFPEQVPSEFQPFVIIDEAHGCYQWCGEGREGQLSSLFDWWWDRRDNCKAGLQPPHPRHEAAQEEGGAAAGRSTLKVKQPSPEERKEYQRQETLRYSNPTSPFQWNLPGCVSCVGPVKGALSVKGKSHAMLDPNRPPFVTVLTLVRDAVSRLSNGEGSRSDIMSLLLDSQYLIDNVDPSGLNTTVSGALDRLQNEVDACVKYDNTKKIWTYLHRDKGLEDFDAVSTGTKPRHRARKKIKLEDLQAAEAEEDTVLVSPGPGGPAHFTAGGSLLTPPRLDRPAAFSQSTPKQLMDAGQDASEDLGDGDETPVQRIIVRGADGQILPLSPGTLRKLFESGAIQTGLPVIDESKNIV